MTVEYRIAEAISRHGPDSPNARARVDRVPYLLAVANRVEWRLAIDAVPAKQCSQAQPATASPYSGPSGLRARVGLSPNTPQAEAG